MGLNIFPLRIFSFTCSGIEFFPSKSSVCPEKRHRTQVIGSIKIGFIPTARVKKSRSSPPKLFVEDITMASILAWQTGQDKTCPLMVVADRSLMDQRDMAATTKKGKPLNFFTIFNLYPQPSKPKLTILITPALQREKFPSSCCWVWKYLYKHLWDSSITILENEKLNAKTQLRPTGDSANLSY